MQGWKQEKRLAPLLHEQLYPHQIPQQVKVLEKTQNSVFSEPVFVYEYIPGKSVSDLHVDRNQKMQFAKLLGDFLTKLHSTDLSKLKDLGFKISTFDSIKKSWFANYKNITSELFDLLDTKEQKFMKEVYEDFLSIVTDISPRVCLVHGDLDPTNILWDGESNFLSIIDWESIEIGSPPGDFCIWWGEYGDEFLHMMLDNYQLGVEDHFSEIVRFYYLRIPMIYFDLYKKSGNKKFLKFGKMKLEKRMEKFV